MRKGKTFKYSDTVLINYEEYGEGDRCIIFIHGFSESIQTWTWIKDRIAEKYRIFLVDLKGFGLSSKPNDDNYSPVDQADIITEIIKNYDLKNLTIIGHSFGGGVALLTVMKLLDEGRESLLKNLVLINSAGYLSKLPVFIRLLRKPLVGVLFFGLFPPRFISKVSLKRVYYDPKKIKEEKISLYAELFKLPGIVNSMKKTARCIIPDNHSEYLDKFSSISIPVLILWGKNDLLLPVEQAHKFNSELPDSEVHVFDNCGHMPHEEYPEETTDLILDFLARK
ncbi:alpha/beta fold hydrolase [candidate division KSB1 bacterium]